MKKIIFLLVSLAGYIAAYAQVPDIQWQKTMGGSAQDQATGVTELTDGNYIVASCVDSNDGDVTDSNGSTDIWLVKLSPEGGVLWKKAFGGTQKDFVEYVSPTADGGFVITGATFSNDGDIPASPNPPDRNILAAKFDSDGNTVWVKNIVGLNGQSIIETSDGGYILAGERYSPGMNVSYDAFIMKMDVNGNSEWQNTYGGAGTMADVAWRIIETSDGNYIFGGSSIAGDNSMLAGQGAQDVWIVKISATGTLLWQKLYGTSNYDDFNGIVEMPDGGFMVACSAFGGGEGNKSEALGNTDAWVLKLDANGNLVWEKSYGTAAADRTSALYKTAEGNYMIGGQRDPQTDIITFFYPADFWAFEISNTGELLSQEGYGGNNSDYLFTFYQTSDYSYLLGGWTYSDNGDAFGNHSAQNDVWVVKIGQSAPLKVCADGTTALFNLTSQTEVLQQSLPNAVITYYTNSNDANAGTNAIATPQAFANATNPQIIYARIQVSDTKWHINHFNLEVLPLPVVASLPDLQACGGGGTAVFDLTQQDAVLLEGQPNSSIAYYTNAQDAQAGTNPITAPATFTNTANPQTVFAAVNNGTCSVVTQFNLVVTPASSLPQLPNLSRCSPDNNGTAQFNLTEQELLLSNENFPVWYFTSQEDAQANTNFIPFPGAFINTQNPQTLYIRAGEGDCYAVGTFEVMVTDGPSPDIANLLEGCPPFNLSQALAEGQEGLQFSYYTSEEDAALAQNAIANTAGYTFAGEQAIVYIRAENAEGCYAIEPVGLAVKDCSIPKGISPNNDNKNNEFDLAFLEVSKLVIYNRYGLEVYSLSNYTTQWHGQDSAGHELPSGVYYYMVQPSNGAARAGWVYLNRESN
jgi:gliding motility-associated-like protein